jgi:Dehydrogenases (flavoproteins)
MKRRDFISRTFLTLGGVMIGKNITYAEAIGEMSDVFTGVQSGHTYDVVINGAGLSGFFTALEASRKGLKVLVVDKRTSPGFDIAAKRKWWLGADGFDQWDDELRELFLPKGELPEIWDEELQGIHKSGYDDQILLFGGSLKKGMLRSLLVNNVDVLLMADVCGIITDNDNRVSGVAVACKHGLLSVACGHFVDASDHCFFTSDLFGHSYNISEASFVIEVEECLPIKEKTLTVSEDIGLIDNKLNVHKGKKYAGHYLFEFRFKPTVQEIGAIEQQARIITGRIGKNLSAISPALSKATIRYYANECSYYLSVPPKPASNISNYSFTIIKQEEYSCQTISDIKKLARYQAEAINKYSATRNSALVHYIGGKCDYIPNDKQITENGKILPFTSFSCDSFDIRTTNVPMLVVGGGTAGSLVAFGAIEKGCKPTVVEFFNDLGGTKTMGGVSAYYLGNQENNYIKKHKNDMEQISATYNMSNIIPRCYFYLKTLTDAGCPVINGAVCCKAEVKNKKLESVIFCRNGRLERITSPLTIDATGDADVAYLAGEKYEVGDSRMGVTQNYSHWDVPFLPKVKNYNRDYDIINSLELSEHQRGLYLSHYESHYYDFYPMQAIRESRRPEGVKRIDTLSIMKNEVFPDTIMQARSDYDPHYFGSSEYTRCAFMLPHYDNKEPVNIPYGAIVSKTIDGLLFSGKAISESYKALQFTRMSADVTILGYVTGLIASGIIRQGVEPRNFSVKEIQSELLAKGYLPAINENSLPVDIPEIVEGLSKGKEEYLFRGCLENSAGILPALTVAYKKKKNILIAKALAWHGNDAGVELILSELEKQYNEELQKGHPSTYYEVYDPSILYWKINQNIGLLAMSRNADSHAIINRILSETKSGGKRVAAGDEYNAGRIDLQLVPYYNRIANLCFYIERNPDHLFVSGLERLMTDENIRGFKTEDYSDTRWKLYGANLELFIAAAAARSGSVKGAEMLSEYITDIHSCFRKFARTELAAIYGTDEGFDAVAWQSSIKKNRIKITPFQIDVEI